MFTGEHKHTVDGKGRLSIPAAFRETLENDFDAPLYVTRMPNCLMAWPADEWEAFARELNSKPAFNKKVMKIKRLLFASAQQCPLDKAGRILLPPKLREDAGIERDVVLAGMGNTFEIWDQARHGEMVMADIDDLEEILDDFSALD